MVILSVILITAIGASFFAPHDPLAHNISKKLLPPFWEEGGTSTHLLGTDHMGRDVLSRLIYGARIALLVASIAIGVACVIGVWLGMVSGYYGGWVDTLIMRVVDIQMSMPALLFAVALAGALKPGLTNVIIIIVVWNWAGFTRIVRGEVLSLKERDFVALAKVAGCSSGKIVLSHILPNVMNSIIVLATLDVGRVIIFEASLSFLGLGVQSPTPAWGSMLAEGRNYVVSAWWLVTFPGLAIMLTCLATNLLGDWLRDAFDPKLREV
ncbi:MAG: ABC transporter permease [Candidatus Tectomicrobia bacterium]|nr:ABC transporter permease [Candidatus Tectomicrobia bacterium]